MLPSATILVPNWNGEAFVVRCVSSALLAAREHRRATGEEIEVLVIDDASTDRSVEMLNRDCPRARLIICTENGGFARAINRGAREAQGKFLVLVNSDMAIRPDFITAILSPLADSQVFAVTAKTVDWSHGEPDHLNMTARLERGQFMLEYSDPPEACDTLFLLGGASALRRVVFLAAGGFSPLYEPGYWEDYDLAHRAVKAGWRIVYEPRALAHHLGKASMLSRHSDVAIRPLVERNRLLFTWSNITDPRALFRHGLGLPLWMVRPLWQGDGAFRLRAFAAALRRLPQVLRHRQAFPPPRTRSDRQALACTRPPAGVHVRPVPDS